MIHWTNQVKFTLNKERWKEEDIEPANDLIGQEIVEDWEDVTMTPVKQESEKVQAEPGRKVPDSDQTQQEKNSLTWWEIMRPQIKNIIQRQKIEEERRIYEDVIKM